MNPIAAHRGAAEALRMKARAILSPEADSGGSTRAFAREMLEWADENDAYADMLAATGALRG